ncbi:hypothetical protein [Colwellia sp. Bg11-12]|uniref:hypothetical protein n=1 Tax=Colwellia sp. Bg11-12 TaxID=2759817 RepID=UPI0015F4C7EF|nr:hypothetical protein [Colwellia sp. Bg11-12]MBA6262212.1 hypothetical protein [Colwellia sp. Bg11-12]
MLQSSMKNVLNISLILLFTGWFFHCMFSDFEYHPEWYAAFRYLLIAVLALTFIYFSWTLFKEWKMGEEVNYKVVLFWLIGSPPTMAVLVYMLIHFPIITLHDLGIIPSQEIGYEANLTDKECSGTGGKVQCFAIVEGIKPQQTNKIPVSFSQAKSLKIGVVSVYTLESVVGRYTIGVMQHNKLINKD